MSPEILKLLCERFPLNSRCTAQSSPTQASPSMPSGGGTLSPTTPPSDTPAPVPAPADTTSAPVNTAPTGGGEITAPSAPPEGGATAPAPEGTEPGASEKSPAPSMTK
jgi:hypothetical protein